MVGSPVILEVEQEETEKNSEKNSEKISAEKNSDKNCFKKKWEKLEFQKKYPTGIRKSRIAGKKKN